MSNLLTRLSIILLPQTPLSLSNHAYAPSQLIFSIGVISVGWLVSDQHVGIQSKPIPHES